MKSRVGMDLTEGSVLKKMIIFVIPIMISSVLQQLYNAADTIVVGQFAGSTALAAVGSSTNLTALILQLFLGLAMGANVVCARLFGAGNRQSLSRAIHTSILLSLISGIGLALIGFFCSRYLLSLMGTPDDVIDSATVYMQIYFMGSPASLVYNFGSGILRAMGETKKPLFILSAAGVVNVLLNLFFVIVVGLDVEGVAIATVVSQMLSAVFVILILAKTDEDLRFEFKKLRIHKAELMNIVAIGIPSGLNGMMFCGSNVILQSTINTFGKDVIAGVTAASNVEIVFYLVLSAIEQGVVSFTGQNIGAGKYKRVDSVMKNALLLSVIGVAALSLLILPNQRILLSIFNKEAAVIEAGMVKITVLCSCYLLYVPSQMSDACMRGMGHPTAPTVINAVCICLTRILWIYLVYPFNPTLAMIFYSYPLSWSLSSLVQFTNYLRTRKMVLRKAAAAEA